MRDIKTGRAGVFSNDMDWRCECGEEWSGNRSDAKRTLRKHMNECQSETATLCYMAVYDVTLEREDTQK